MAPPLTLEEYVKLPHAFQLETRAQAARNRLSIAAAEHSDGNVFQFGSDESPAVISCLREHVSKRDATIERERAVALQTSDKTLLKCMLAKIGPHVSTFYNKHGMRLSKREVSRMLNAQSLLLCRVNDDTKVYMMGGNETMHEATLQCLQSGAPCIATLAFQGVCLASQQWSMEWALRNILIYPPKLLKPATLLPLVEAFDHDDDGSGGDDMLKEGFFQSNGLVDDAHNDGSGVHGAGVDGLDGDGLGGGGQDGGGQDGGGLDGDSNDENNEIDDDEIDDDENDDDENDDNTIRAILPYPDASELFELPFDDANKKNWDDW